MLLLIFWAALPGVVRAQVRGDTPAVVPFINRVEITGNEHISDKELKRQMKTRAPAFYNIFRKPRLDTSTLARDVAQLEGYYHTAGYFDASVVVERLDYSLDGRFVDIIIKVSEGDPTLVESVEFSPNSLIDDKELRKGLFLAPGEPYNASYLDTDVYKLQSKYFERGYLGVSIRDRVEVNGHRVAIFFEIEPGTQIRIRNVEISGNTLSKTGIIEKEVAFKPGDVCRLSKLVETQRNLYETGLFTVADINPENLDPMERTVDIHIRVRERKAAYVEGGVGVGNILGSRIFAQWGTRNLLGWGRGVRLRTEYGFDLFEGNAVDFDKLQFRNNYWRYDAEYHQRYLFGYKALMSIDAFVEKDNTVEEILIRKVGAQLSTRRRLSRFTDLLAGFSDEFIRRTAVDEPKEETETRYITTSLNDDRRDFILNPRTGAYRFARVKIAGGYLGGDNDFYTISVASQWYWQLIRGDVLAVRVRGGYGARFGQSEVVPIEDRYFAGGGNSVRGYENNSLGPKYEDEETGNTVPRGGNALLLTNLELRFDIPVLSRINFTGAMFFDGGNVWEDAADIKLSDFAMFRSSGDVDINDYRYSVGLGIRYNTPIGPIRLDYGVPLKVEEGVSDNGRFHLSLGQIF